MPIEQIADDETALSPARHQINSSCHWGRYHAIRHEPSSRDGRGDQFLPGETLENLATQPRSDSRHKERRCRAVDRVIVAAGHLMQRAERQAASQQMPVYRLDAEGPHCPQAASRALDAPDALAKLLDTGTGDGRALDLGNGLGG